MNIKSLLKTVAFLLSAVFTISACGASEPGDRTLSDSVLTNGSFGGIALDRTSASVAEPLEIPTKSSAEPVLPVLTSEQDTYTEESTLTPPEASQSEESSPAETTEEVTEEQTSASSAEDTATKTTTTKATTTKATTTTTKATTTTTKATTTTTKATTATTAAATTSAATETVVQNNRYGMNSYTALNHKTVKAVWISYIEINNLLKQQSEAEFRKSIGKIYDNCASMGLNTVYVHVRAFGDAFYHSELYPFTKYLSGTLGKKTAYDPLNIMIDEAHKRDISFHAWINPLRLNSASDIASVSSDYAIGKWYKGAENGKYIVNVGGTYYLNPAYEEAISLVGNGVREIVSGYDVDGLHIDDYFYPTTDASFDSAAYSAFGSGTLSSFRINNCNKLVKEIYNAVNDCSKTVVFGASTQGNMHNNLTQLYADTEAWCKGGYIDYFAPQVYYGFENSGVPFKGCVDDWSELVSGTKVKLYIGLSLYKIGEEDTWAGAGKQEWINTRTMIKRQIEYSFDTENCDGIALYCYNYLFSPGYHNSKIQEEIDNFKNLLI